MRTTVALEKIGQLLEGRHENPFDVLGPHEVDNAGRRALAVRAFLPDSAQAWVLDPAHDGRPGRPMRRIHPAGVFEAVCPLSKANGRPRYMIQTVDHRGSKTTMHDPYSFPHFLTDYDLHLMNEGTHWQVYDRLGPRSAPLTAWRG